MNFNEILRKNLTCDNIKKSQKSGLHLLPWKLSFNGDQIGNLFEYSEFRHFLPSFYVISLDRIYSFCKRHLNI